MKVLPAANKVRWRRHATVLSNMPHHAVKWVGSTIGHTCARGRVWGRLPPLARARSTYLIPLSFRRLYGLLIKMEQNPAILSF